MRIAYLLMVGLAWLLVGCQVKLDQDPLSGTSWVLQSAEPGPDIMAQPPFTLTFENGLLQGSTGCNQYRMNYELQVNNRLRSWEQTVTEKACADSLMRQENRLLALMRYAVKYQLANDQLRLYSASGALNFRPVDVTAAAAADSLSAAPDSVRVDTIR